MCIRDSAKTDLVTNATIEKIIKLLRCAFKQAVRWELIAKNPFDNVVLPKTEYKKRDIWTADMIRTALDQCTDSKLYVAMNLSFACSLRMGEIPVSYTHLPTGVSHFGRTDQRPGLDFSKGDPGGAGGIPSGVPMQLPADYP